MCTFDRSEGIWHCRERFLLLGSADLFIPAALLQSRLFPSVLPVPWSCCPWFGRQLVRWLEVAQMPLCVRLPFREQGLP